MLEYHQGVSYEFIVDYLHSYGEYDFDEECVGSALKRLSQYVNFTYIISTNEKQEFYYEMYYNNKKYESSHAFNNYMECLKDFLDTLKTCLLD